MDVDYNKLKTFLVVAEKLSFTQASIQLRRSQSAISQQIQALEEELGLRLLERKAKRIFLSKEGERIFRQAKFALSQIDDEVSQIKDSTSAVVGHVKLGVVNEHANEFDVGSSIGKFLQKYPNINMSVSFGTCAEIEARLIENALDLGILINFKHSKLFQKYPLNWSEHTAYASKKYLSEIKTPIKTYKDLLEAALVDLNEDFACFSAWLNKNAPKTLPMLKRRRPSIVVPNHQVAMEIISSGYGIALLPSHLALPAVSKGRLVEVMKSSKTVRTGLDLAIRTGRTPRLVEKFLIDEVLAL